MNTSEIGIWLTCIGIIELIAVFVAVFGIFPADSHMHPLQKAGFAFLVFGLVVQIIRSLHFLEHGTYPIDHIFPFWATKDIGAVTLIYYYAFVFPKVKK